jgi:hypothetical protein
MKKILIPTLLVSFVWLFMSCRSGKTYELKMRLAEGDHFEQNMQMAMRMHYGIAGQPMNMNMGTEIASVFDVQKSTPDEKQIKMSYSSSKMSLDMGKLGPALNLDSMMNNANGKIVGKSVTIVLSKDNEIKDVLGAEFFEKDVSDSATREIAKKMFSKEQVNSLFGMMFSIYPGKRVAIGDSWTKENKVNMGEFEMKIKTKYTLAAVSGNAATINVYGTINGKGNMLSTKMEMDMKGSQKGTMTIDITNGYLQKGKYSMLMTALMNAGGQKMPITINADYNMSGK